MGKLETMYSVGENGVPAIEDSVEVPQKTKNRISIWASIWILLCIYACGFWIVAGAPGELDLKF